MLPQYEVIHLLYLLLAILLEVIANILLKHSKGFEYKLPAFGAIVCVFAAFTALSVAIEGFRLSVAYSIWGGLGLILTAFLSIVLFGERLHATGWIGVLLVLVGMFLVRLS